MKMNEKSDLLAIQVRPRATTHYEPHTVSFCSDFVILDKYLKQPILAPYVPDQKHVTNQIASAIHRFGCKMPVPASGTATDFRAYAVTLIRLLFKPITSHDIPTFEQWLERTHYDVSRKQYFRQVRESLTGRADDYNKSKSFIKYEGYLEPKNPRSINSPSDESKVLLGPLLKAVDKATFSQKYFVKGSDPKTWPDRLEERFGQKPVMTTDYSSFESHHHGVYANVVHYWMMHMLRLDECPRWVKKLVSKMVLGVNDSEFSSIKVQIPQRLMSGALWTSSSNSVLNLLITTYLVLKSRHPDIEGADLSSHIEEFEGFFEGDDGICVADAIDEGLVRRMGLKLKFGFHKNYSTASFCGVVCDPACKANTTDPSKILRKFFWLDKKYKSMRATKQHSLLRAKALSLKYQYNDCPVVGPLCHRICEQTRGLNLEHVPAELGLFKTNILERAIQSRVWIDAPNISDSTRELVEIAFGMTVQQQLDIERVIRETPLTQRSLELDLTLMLNDSDLQHYDSHVSSTEIWPVPDVSHLPKVVRNIVQNRKLKPAMRVKPTHTIGKKVAVERIVP